MNTTSENKSEVTSQHETYNIEVHPVILAFVLTTVCWILFANTIIVVCFIRNRKKAWPYFVAQIFCLSLSDLFVGLVALPWIIIPIAKPDDLPVSYVWCSVIFYLLMCSQCGSLYHILTICAHRCIRIQTSASITEPRKNRMAPFCFALLGWSIGFIVCTLPFVFWTDTEGTMYSCLMQEMFVDSKKAMGVFGISLFLPQVLTNILYVVACLRMRCIWRRVFPNNPDSTLWNSNSINLAPAPSGYSRANARIQSRFMGTVGIVMLFFNICTLPLISLYFLEHKGMTGRNFRYAAGSVFVFNSALNPFIYAFRSSWLMNALKQFIKNISVWFV